MYEGTDYEMAIQQAVFSKRGCDRVMRYAFDLAANVVGTLAALCSITSFAPQMIKIWKERDASSVSLKTYSLTVICFVLWTTYGVLTGAWPIIVANLITFALFFVVNTPDDMARMQLGVKRVTPEAIQKWKVERGYDKPLLINAALITTIGFTLSCALCFVMASRGMRNAEGQTQSVPSQPSRPPAFQASGISP